jgi:hypothetical protein
MSRQRKLRQALNRAIGAAQGLDSVARQREEELEGLFAQMLQHDVALPDLVSKLQALAETQSQADFAWQAASRALEAVRPLLQPAVLALPTALIEEAQLQSHRILAELEQWTAALKLYVEMRDRRTDE